MIAKLILCRNVKSIVKKLQILRSAMEMSDKSFIV